MTAKTQVGNAVSEDDIVRLDDVPVAKYCAGSGYAKYRASTLAGSYRRFKLKFVYETATLRLPSDERHQHKRNKADRTYRGSDGDLHRRLQAAPRRI